MEPEKVKPAKFHVHTVIYNNGNFSVAYGKWENSDIRIAMRWNGESDDDIGYPSQGGNPLWFQLPNDGVWTSEILQAIDRINAFEQRIGNLNSKL
ncbi:MAG: hypothetical protein JXB49_25655 [Bacteroidales bacterium]|nr:hypothetical protein [Bacteroidales bacterium]